jgi:hypothetical protein
VVTTGLELNHRAEEECSSMVEKRNIVREKLKEESQNIVRE